MTTSNVNGGIEFKCDYCGATFHVNDNRQHAPNDREASAWRIAQDAGWKEAGFTIVCGNHDT